MASRQPKNKKVKEVPPVVQPQPESELPVEEKSADKKNTVFITVAVFLVGVVTGVLIAKVQMGNPAGKQSGPATSKCQVITKVKINPEKIVISPENGPLELSALAYETENTPIWQGVSYDWGISSSNSVGTLKQNNDLVTFIPLQLGRGDLFVKATNACTETPVIGSIPVLVQEKIDEEIVEPTINGAIEP